MTKDVAAGVGPFHLPAQESVLVLDKEPVQLGYDTTITFYNGSERFSYRKPDHLVDVTSGVICCPNNRSVCLSWTMHGCRK